MENGDFFKLNTQEFEQSEWKAKRFSHVAIHEDTKVIVARELNRASSGVLQLFLTMKTKQVMT